MPETSQYQVVVIGTGPGGYVAAIRAAQLGLKTAVVEKDELGGTCLNWGCIPTKAWIVTAHLYEQIRRAKEFGIDVGEPKINWPMLVERKNKVVKQLTGGVKALLAGRGVDIHRGTARLASANRVVVTAADGRKTEIPAEHVIVATGADATMPPGFKLDGERVITSKEALDLSKQPKRIAVLGGGVVGTEFACFFAAIGTQVTLIEMLPRLVPAEDDEIAQTLEREMKKQRIDLHLNTKVEDMKDGDGGTRVLTLTGGTTRHGRHSAGRHRATAVRRHVWASRRSGLRAAIAARSSSTTGCRLRSRASMRSATSPTSSSSRTSPRLRARRRPS